MKLISLSIDSCEELHCSSSVVVVVVAGGGGGGLFTVVRMMG